MRLCDALGIRKAEVVALVGAGGKTTAMYRLGRELADQSWRVITTTTTMIRPPSAGQSGHVIVESDRDRALQLVREALTHSIPVTLASQYLSAENKLKGVDPGWITLLAEMADAIIIEADGARGLSLKAPAAYEPVVPLATTLLVPMVGIDVIGRRLVEGVVHRPSLVAALTGLAPGDTVNVAAIASLLVHRQGALKNVPDSARVVVLINKAENEPAREAARQVAGQVQKDAAVDRVVVAAVAGDDPVSECWRRVSAVVLAAGGSKRLGRPKQLLPLAGRTMIEQVLGTVMAVGVHEVIVVLGHAAAPIAEHMPSGCRLVLNPDWESGISSSLRAGLAAVDPRTEAALFVLADQPHMTAEAMTRIVRAYYGTTKSIVVPVHQGTRGNPVLFDRRHFGALEALSGDLGGREVIAACAGEVLPVEMESAELFLDIDTPEDYQGLLATADKGILNGKNDA